MDWTKFSNHGESNDHAFEVMCNLLFEKWCHEEYGEKLVQFAFVNGAGGDGGVEAFGVLDNGDILGVQSKWFPDKLDSSHIIQIRKSFETAMKVRPNIVKYIVCIPRDLTSSKIGKDKRIVANTENNRWGAFINDEKTSFTNTEIILWEETRIQERLLSPYSTGIYKYWFENTLVFDKQIETSFQKAISSWAKAKYIPEVYSFGEIHNKLEFFLGTKKLSERRYKSVAKFVNRLSALKRSYLDLIQLGIPEKEKSLQEKIERDIEVIAERITELDFVVQSIKCGTRIVFKNPKIGLKCSSNDFKDSSLHFGKYFHFNETEKLLENIADDFYLLQSFLDDTSDNRLVIIGNQGTGKTAGIVAEASRMFEENSHLPILVHAKDFSEGYTWLDILIKSIGLSNTWDERSLLSALQTAALLRNREEDDDYCINPKCVICVDGLDEAKSWTYWKEKIDEVIAYKDDYPRIKFVFLSRPYVFGKVYELDYSDRVFRIQPDGDISVDKICDKYFFKYNINVGNNNWIRRLFRTPDSVRLFCDIYKDKSINGISQNTIVITNLYKRKIEELDKEFCEKRRNGVSQGLLKSALFEIADIFMNSEAVSYSAIAGYVSEQTKNILNEVLDFLSTEGFLYTIIKQEDEFSAPQTLFSWGRQPALDYLLARKLHSKLKAGEEVIIGHTDGINQMLSLIAIEDGQPLFEYKNVKIDESEMFELICYALANCSVTIAMKYRDYTKRLMSTSPAVFREIVNQVVIPVSDTENHPLGAGLLDEFLGEFGTPSKRDIWWSIPAYLKDNYYAYWRVYTEVAFSSIELSQDDKYNAKPLILAWSLTSVNNELRQESRMKLVEWGIGNPREYWKLFCECQNSNDIQMIEDLFAIAYGVSLDRFVIDEYLVDASKWMIDNVFSDQGLVRFLDSAIRYYVMILANLGQRSCNSRTTFPKYTDSVLVLSGQETLSQRDKLTS